MKNINARVIVATIMSINVTAILQTMVTLVMDIPIINMETQVAVLLPTADIPVVKKKKNASSLIEITEHLRVLFLLQIKNPIFYRVKWFFSYHTLYIT
jgi:hypothetical protein